MLLPERGTILAMEEREGRKVKTAAKRINNRRPPKRGASAAQNAVMSWKAIRHWVLDDSTRLQRLAARNAFNGRRHGCISCGTKTAFARHAGHSPHGAAAPNSALTRTISGSSAPHAMLFTNQGTSRRTVPLVELIGEERVLALESNNETRRYTRRAR
ncbi:recombination protein NinG [Enterobacter roggenkampii]|uniref:recombination protein NinG n=1 Tax=Enterobacter roggenkampii TaxID=1812935 RepID=UPI001FD72B7B|nr:recombination protein NinG [Enterobacter roggenkampii]